MKSYRSWGLLFVLVLLNGCEREIEPATMPVRPVTVIELLHQDFARDQTLTGVVDLYREEDIGFEISGRVTTVLDEGLEVRGPAFNEQGDPIRRGDPIAAMESARYGSQVGALQARLEAARRNLQAVEAQVTLARQTLDRRNSILAEGLVSQQVVDDAQSTFDQASAQLAAQQAAAHLLRALREEGVPRLVLEERGAGWLTRSRWGRLRRLVREDAVATLSET